MTNESSPARTSATLAPVLAELAAKMRIERTLGRRIDPIWTNPVIRASNLPPNGLVGPTF
jgi:hypothetical protein